MPTGSAEQSSPWYEPGWWIVNCAAMRSAHSNPSRFIVSPPANPAKPMHLPYRSGRSDRDRESERASDDEERGRDVLTVGSSATLTRLQAGPVLLVRTHPSARRRAHRRHVPAASEICARDESSAAIRFAVARSAARSLVRASKAPAARGAPRRGAPAPAHRSACCRGRRETAISTADLAPRLRYMKRFEPPEAADVIDLEPFQLRTHEGDGSEHALRRFAGHQRRRGRLAPADMAVAVLDANQQVVGMRDPWRSPSLSAT
jgi:hypothetical protein